MLLRGVGAGGNQLTARQMAVAVGVVVGACIIAALFLFARTEERTSVEAREATKVARQVGESATGGALQGAIGTAGKGVRGVAIGVARGGAKGLAEGVVKAVMERAFDQRDPLMVKAMDLAQSWRETGCIDLHPMLDFELMAGNMSEQRPESERQGIEMLAIAQRMASCTEVDKPVPPHMYQAYCRMAQLEAAKIKIGTLAWSRERREAFVQSESVREFSEFVRACESIWAP